MKVDIWRVECFDHMHDCYTEIFITDSKELLEAIGFLNTKMLGSMNLLRVEQIDVISQDEIAHGGDK